MSRRLRIATIALAVALAAAALLPILILNRSAGTTNTNDPAADALNRYANYVNGDHTTTDDQAQQLLTTFTTTHHRDGTTRHTRQSPNGDCYQITITNTRATRPTTTDPQHCR